jgi:hypothetical protein
MTTPYDVNIITIYQTVDQQQQPTLAYASFPGTVDRGELAAYFQFVNPMTGAGTDYTTLHLKNGGSVVIDMTYAAFDAL